VLYGHRSGYPQWGLEDREDHGHSDHQGDTTGGCLRGIRRCHDLVHDRTTRHTGKHHAYHHRCDHWCWGYETVECGTLGRDRSPAMGLGPYHSGERSLGDRSPTGSVDSSGSDRGTAAWISERRNAFLADREMRYRVEGDLLPRLNALRAIACADGGTRPRGLLQVPTRYPECIQHPRILASLMVIWGRSLLRAQRLPHHLPLGEGTCGYRSHRSPEVLHAKDPPDLAFVLHRSIVIRGPLPFHARHRDLALQRTGHAEYRTCVAHGLAPEPTGLVHWGRGAILSFLAGDPAFPSSSASHPCVARVLHWVCTVALWSRFPQFTHLEGP
jgi:hypothetical protein